MGQNNSTPLNIFGQDTAWRALAQASSVLEYKMHHNWYKTYIDALYLRLTIEHSTVQAAMFHLWHGNAWYLSGHAWSPQSCCLPVGWTSSGVPAALLAAPKAVTSSGLQQQMLHDLGRHYPHHHCPSFKGPHATTNRKSLGRSNLQFIYNQAIKLNSIRFWIHMNPVERNDMHVSFCQAFWRECRPKVAHGNFEKAHALELAFSKSNRKGMSAARSLIILLPSSKPT